MYHLKGLLIHLFIHVFSPAKVQPSYALCLHSSCNIWKGSVYCHFPPNLYFLVKIIKYNNKEKQFNLKKKCSFEIRHHKYLTLMYGYM